MRVEKHVVDRIQQRFNEPDVTRSDVERMWKFGERRDILSAYYEEARYFKPMDILLLYRDGRIVTALPGEDRHFVVELYLCDWCGKNVVEQSDCQKCCGYKYEEYLKEK